MSLNLGSLIAAAPVFPAPMAGYTDWAFRLGLRELGGITLTFSEMIDPKSVLFGKGRRRAALLATHPADAPLGVQLYGADPERMAAAAQLLQEQGAGLIDINMGCPQRKIMRRGEGAGLLRDPARALALARRVAGALRVPVTAKLRLGVTAAEPVAVRLAADLEQAGIAALTIHGRYAEQGFAGRADWDMIRTVAAATERIPVFGNGDVDSPESARTLLAATGCAGVMIGRALLRDPWLALNIARSFRGLAPLRPTQIERIAFFEKHLMRLVSQHGDRVGLLLARRWLPLYAPALRLPRPDLVALLRTEAPADFRRQLDAHYRAILPAPEPECVRVFG